MERPTEEIKIDLCFNRHTLDNFLATEFYEPEILVELFRRGVQGMQPPIYNRGGHVGFRSSADHALSVLHQFENYYAHMVLPGGVDENFFRVILVLHDIGYPLGGRYGQHGYTVPMVKSILELLKYDEAKIRTAIALISKDPLGYYFVGEPGFQYPENAMKVIRDKAVEAGMEFEEFFNLLVIFYSCDASSYRHLAHLFRMYPATRQIGYRGNVEIGMRECRKVLAEVLAGTLEL
jgi:hypothetical protein